jgi:CRISPR-associated protein Cas1
MHPLYIVEQGARLSHNGRRLVISKDNAKLSSAPVVHVSEVVLMGNIGLTTPVIKLLLRENIDVVFLTQDGSYCGRLVGQATPHVILRRKQYRCQEDGQFLLAMAQAIVRGKIANMRTLLMKHNRERGDPLVSAAIESLGQALEQVPRKTAIASLSGVEGAATAAYFGAWKRLLKDDWKFEKRLRRPPPDPINVMLSFGYTLLARTVQGAVESTGLDPYAGFLHSVEYNRPSLALDLMEEFRPVVDGVILWCCNGDQVTPGDFTPGNAKRPVVISDQAKKRFIQAYERRMEQKIAYPRRVFAQTEAGEQLPLRRCIHAQARQIVGCVQKFRPDYQAMEFR